MKEWWANFRDLNSAQRHTVAASFLGWTLDAFDFFLLVFVLGAIAHDFHADITEVTFAIFLTLAARPLGALIFGRLADRFGRRPVLMVDIAIFSILEFATAFSPNLTVLLVLRFLFGIGMGGEWGIGTSLAMETIPPQARGAVSGLLQSGYPCGYFLGAIAYWLVFRALRLARHVRGRRTARAAGAVPARQGAGVARLEGGGDTTAPRNAKVHARTLEAVAYMMLLMTAFNMFSHGSQDMYPTFLKAQLHFGAGTVTC